MVRLEIATALLAWAAGGWFFLWVTTRRREVGLGYGWLLRAIFLLLAIGAVVVGSTRIGSGMGMAYNGSDMWLGVAGGDASRGSASVWVWVRYAAVTVFIGTGVVAAVVSVARRRAGVAVQRAEAERRSARVSGMTSGRASRPRFDASAREFPPMLDLVAAVTGMLAAMLAASAGDGQVLLAIARVLVGALFLGAVTGAMLLGHWYLVQPGLPRATLLQLVRATGWMWPSETAVMLWPTGMMSVFDGSIDDGYNGLLGWFWLACAVATISLVLTALAALRERQYSAVMAATGLMYLAILTAFGQDLVARVLLTA